MLNFFIKSCQNINIYIYIYIYTQEKEKVKTINKLENKPTIKTQPFQERKRTDFFFYGARPPT